MLILNRYRFSCAFFVLSFLVFTSCAKYGSLRLTDAAEKPMKAVLPVETHYLTFEDKPINEKPTIFYDGVPLGSGEPAVDLLISILEKCKPGTIIKGERDGSFHFATGYSPEPEYVTPWDYKRMLINEITARRNLALICQGPCNNVIFRDGKTYRVDGSELVLDALDSESPTAK